MELNEKYFITPEQLRVESYELGRRVITSGFKPDFMVAIWRGGTSVGSYVHELLKCCDIKPDHIAVRTSTYKGIDEMHDVTTVDGLEYVIEKANYFHSLLIVDDVHDKGITIKSLVEELSKRSRANTPNNIKVATVYYKPNRNKTNRVPDFYVHETDKWIVFPHELEGLTAEEIKVAFGDTIYQIVEDAKASVRTKI